MKILNTFFALAFAIGAYAQSGVEGKISMTALSTSTKETAEIEWYIKNNKHSMDFSTHAEGQAMNYTIVVENGSTKMLADGAEPITIPASSFEKTGFDVSNYMVTEKAVATKLNGYACTKYTIQTNENVVEYWLTNETALTIADFPAFMQKGLLGPADKLQPGSIPVKLEVKDINGKLLYSYTINSITYGKVDRF